MFFITKLSKQKNFTWHRSQVNWTVKTLAGKILISVNGGVHRKATSLNVVQFRIRPVWKWSSFSNVQYESGPVWKSSSFGIDQLESGPVLKPSSLEMSPVVKSTRVKVVQFLKPIGLKVVQFWNRLVWKWSSFNTDQFESGSVWKSSSFWIRPVLKSTSMEVV